MARQFQWMSADGQLITLTDRAAGYRVMGDGTTGLNAPSYRFTTSQYAGIDGVNVDAISADAREVVLGMLIQATGVEQLRERTTALTRAMRPKAGAGQLIVTNESGQARTLTCHYTAGLEGSEARDTKLPGRWWKFAIHLTAFTDPWWAGEPRSVSFGLGAPSVFFPIFPLTLSPSTVQGEFTVDLSDADAPTYPLWTIRGPGSELVLTNQTTGLSLAVDVDLAPDALMLIDTRPGMQSVRMADGTNLMGSVVGDPALWPLVEDVNFVSATMTGAAAASRITAELIPRYAGA